MPLSQGWARARWRAGKETSHVSDRSSMCGCERGEPTYIARPTLFWVRSEKLQDEVLGVVANVLPVPLVEHHVASGALVDQVLEVLGAERRVATKQSVGNDAQRPHVHGLAVALLKHHLGCRITE